MTTLAIFTPTLRGQEAATTGSVQGTAKDDSGTPIAGARVTIRNRPTQTTVTVRTDSAGNFVSSDPLPTGIYTVRVEARDYRTVDLTTDVKAGATARVDAILTGINPGPAKLESRVPEPDLHLLPSNGRNFVDLARLEPGVEVADGLAIAANKAGFSAVSVDDRAGRNTRIALDGLDVTDETVGATTQNVTAGAVNELRLTRALPDVASALASAGEVNVLTRSGADSLHGNGFYNFRDQGVGFAGFPGGLDTPWQRHQYGGSVGGPFIKDKVFFFAGGEHTKQDGQNPVGFGFPFNRLAAGYNAPLRETLGTARLDWQIKEAARLFYRFNYDHNSQVASLSNFAPFLNLNNIPSHAAGLDVSAGKLTNSVRFGYGKFVNRLASALVGGVFDPAPSVNVVVGQLQTGPSSVGQQISIQRNLQARYDGSKPSEKHTVHFGGSVNRIETGGSQALGALAPTVSGAPTLANIEALLNNPRTPFGSLVSGDIAGAADNPLNYPVTGITIYNGRGFSSEQSAFGFPGGGHFDTRIEAYAEDTWRVLHNLNVSPGVHFVRDTGRSDADLVPVTCSQINTTRFPNPPCRGTGLLLDQFGNITGLGSQVRQPDMNFGPQVGVSWDPGSNGKTLVRLGGGLYYENNLFQNTFLDRRSRVAQGQFFGSANLCPTGAVLFPNGTAVSSIDGLNIATQICGRPIGMVSNAIADLQAAYQASTNAIGVSNPYFLGNALAGSGLLAPNYRSPRVVQINVGVQREIRHGSMLSIDFVRTIGTHFPLGFDTNHLGDSRYLDTSAAVAAINATLAANPLSVACSPALGADSSALTAVNCYLARVPGANIADFARHGLDSANAYCDGLPCSVLGRGAAAFPGVNSLVGSNVMYFPVGRSLYNGLQMALRTSGDHPLRGVRHMDLAISYTFSRFKDNVPSAGGAGVIADEDLLATAEDFRQPTRFMGPGSLDRTHQFSFRTLLELPHGLQLSGIGYFASPLPVTLLLPQNGGGGVPGEIFRSDTNGDGTVADLLPGTGLGAFGRDVSTTNLSNTIRAYDSNAANQLTPSGTALVNAGLFTSAQLTTLGAVMPTIQTPPAGNIGLGWLKSLDLKLARPIRFTEAVAVEPSVSVFNVFNFANFDAPQLRLNGILDASPGRAVNNATKSCGSIPGVCTAHASRVGPGSGTYSLGAARQLEFGFRVTF
jgi:hypothetical protein